MCIVFDTRPYLCEQLLEEGADERGDLVPVQQVEAAPGVAVVVHEAVGVAVERAASLARRHGDACRHDNRRHHVNRKWNTCVYLAHNTAL